MTFSVIERELTEIYSAPLWGNCPQHVGQVLEAKLGGIFQALELGVDFDIRFFAFDLSFAGCARHQR